MEDVFQWTRSRTAVNARRVFMEPCATSRKSSSIHAERFNANMVTVRYLKQEMPTVIVRWTTVESYVTRVRKHKYKHSGICSWSSILFLMR